MNWEYHKDGCNCNQCKPPSLTTCICSSVFITAVVGFFWFLAFVNVHKPCYDEEHEVRVKQPAMFCTERHTYTCPHLFVTRISFVPGNHIETCVGCERDISND